MARGRGRAGLRSCDVRPRAWGMGQRWRPRVGSPDMAVAQRRGSQPLTDFWWVLGV